MVSVFFYYYYYYLLLDINITVGLCFLIVSSQVEKCLWLLLLLLVLLSIKYKYYWWALLSYLFQPNWKIFTAFIVTYCCCYCLLLDINIILGLHFLIVFSQVEKRLWLLYYSCYCLLLYVTIGLSIMCSDWTLLSYLFQPNWKVFMASIIINCCCYCFLLDINITFGLSSVF